MPPQHGWFGSPQLWHSPSAVEHVMLDWAQVLPAQQGWPSKPQFAHLPATQTEFGMKQAPLPLQQVCVGAPQLPLGWQTPAWHVRPVLLQVVPLQQAWV